MMDVTRRHGRRRKQLLGDIQEMRGFWKLEKVTLDRNLWRSDYGRGCGPVVRQTT